MTRSTRTPILVATAVVVPLLLLELVSAAGGEPPTSPGNWLGVLSLYVVMWFLAFGFVIVVAMVVRDMTTGGYATAHPAKVGARVGLLILLAASFAVMAIDRATCFVGLLCD